MATAPKILIQQALEAIFDATANAMPATTNFNTPTVRVKRKVISPDQAQALADFSQYLGQHPTLTRSGDAIAVVFTC